MNKSLGGIMFRRTFGTMKTLRAFSLPCEKANVSLMGDSFNVFPKPTGKIKYGIDWGELIMKMNLKLKKEIVLFDMTKVTSSLEKLGGKFDSPFWEEEWRSRHAYLWHQDGFDRNNEHYHAQFPHPIDKSLLGKIADALVLEKVLSSQERDQLIQAYDTANEMTEKDVESIIESNRKASKHFSSASSEATEPTQTTNTTSASIKTQLKEVRSSEEEHTSDKSNKP